MGRGVAGGKTPKELQDLQKIVEIAGRTVSRNASAMDQATAQHAAQAPRVQHTTTRITSSLPAMQAPVPRVEPTPERPAIETRPAPRVRVPTPTPSPRDT